MFADSSIKLLTRHFGFATASVVYLATAIVFCNHDLSIAATYDTGADDAAIRIGNTSPYSGPASAYGAIGKAMAAYFAQINDRGGINGRRIEFVTLDDGYSPPKTVEQVRKLVEQDEVLLIFGSVGTPTNSAVYKYLNAKNVPHLFLATGAATWDQPDRYPWTMGYWPAYGTEARIYARYIMDTIPDARIAVLYQNDDYGKDYLRGLEAGLGDLAGRAIVAAEPYEVSDPTIDSQIVALKASGANVFANFSSPKFSAQAIRKAHDIGWHPVQVLNSGSSSVEAVMVPAGPDKAAGVITAAHVKDPTDPQWQTAPDYRAWSAWMDIYYPDGSKADMLNVYGYASAFVLAHVLRRCGDELTRANVMAQARAVRDLEVPMLLPGIRITTGAADFQPIEQLQLMRFDGRRWVPFGAVIDAR